MTETERECRNWWAAAEILHFWNKAAEATPPGRRGAQYLAGPFDSPEEAYQALRLAITPPQGRA